MTSRPAPWILSDTTAQWQRGDLSLRVDLERIECQARFPAGSPPAAQPLTLWHLEYSADSGAPAQLAGTYVRGDDLVARYRSTDGARECEIYWRSITSSLDPVTACVEWLASWQTSRLEDRIDCRLVSRLDSPSVMRCDAAVGHCEPPSSSAAPAEDRPIAAIAASWDGSGGYVELGWPSDYNALEVAPIDEVSGDSLTSIAWHVVEPNLEKGVIRRVRFRAYFLDRAPTGELVAACQSELADSPMPLTA